MKLLSFGEIIFDIYPDKQTLGGAPLNLAAYATMLGTQSFLASAIGTDRLGALALEEIKALGIATKYISCSAEKMTGQCLISLDKNGVPSYEILRDVAYDKIALPHFPEERFDILAFGTLALREKHNRAVLSHLLEENKFSEIVTMLSEKKE